MSYKKARKYFSVHIHFKQRAYESTKHGAHDCSRHFSRIGRFEDCGLVNQSNHLKRSYKHSDWPKLL